MIWTRFFHLHYLKQKVIYSVSWLKAFWLCDEVVFDFRFFALVCFLNVCLVSQHLIKDQKGSILLFLCLHRKIKGLFGLGHYLLAYAFVRLLERADGNNLWHVFKLFSSYFYKLSKMAYENNSYLIRKLPNLIASWSAHLTPSASAKQGSTSTDSNLHLLWVTIPVWVLFFRISPHPVCPLEKHLTFTNIWWDTSWNVPALSLL